MSTITDPATCQGVPRAHLRWHRITPQAQTSAQATGQTQATGRSPAEAAGGADHRRSEMTHPIGPRIPRDDEENTILLLAATWALETGRALPTRPPRQMSEEELIEFWADPAWDHLDDVRGPANPEARS